MSAVDYFVEALLGLCILIIAAFMVLSFIGIVTFTLSMDDFKESINEQMQDITDKIEGLVTKMEYKNELLEIRVSNTLEEIRQEFDSMKFMET